MRHHHPHAHSHGLIEPSIKRSREGLDAVTRSLLVLAATAAAQALVSSRREAWRSSPT